MWAPWLRSPSCVQSASKPPKRTFSCSSFKDIQTLCEEESKPEPKSRKSSTIFHRIRSTSLLAWAHRSATPPPSPLHSSQPSITLSGVDQLIVIYFTSLRVVRKTFEDCRAVRSILRGFRVRIDERDVSMDVQFLEELQEIIRCKKLSLPIVFVGGRYIGGPEEIRQLHECGELKKLMARLPEVDQGSCDLCGGLRFIVCERCDGSHRIYVEKTGFRICTVCNVNGLIRCPSCSSVLQRTSKK